jgi:hypothetical protein
MQYMCHNVDYPSMFEPAFRDALKSITQSQFNRPCLPAAPTRLARVAGSADCMVILPLNHPTTLARFNLACATLHQYTVRLPCKIMPRQFILCYQNMPPAPPVWRATPTPTPRYTHTVVIDELCRLCVANCTDCRLFCSSQQQGVNKIARAVWTPFEALHRGMDEALASQNCRHVEQSVSSAPKADGAGVQRLRRACIGRERLALAQDALEAQHLRSTHWRRFQQHIPASALHLLEQTYSQRDHQGMVHG